MYSFMPVGFLPQDLLEMDAEMIRLQSASGACSSSDCPSSQCSSADMLSQGGPMPSASNIVMPAASSPSSEDSSACQGPSSISSSGGAHSAWSLEDSQTQSTAKGLGLDPGPSGDSRVVEAVGIHGNLKSSIRWESDANVEAEGMQGGQRQTDKRGSVGTGRGQFEPVGSLKVPRKTAWSQAAG